MALKSRSASKGERLSHPAHWLPQDLGRLLEGRIVSAAQVGEVGAFAEVKRPQADDSQHRNGHCEPEHIALYRVGRRTTQLWRVALICSLAIGSHTLLILTRLTCSTSRGVRRFHHRATMLY